MRQFSLFGAEAADPSIADLAGLLAGPAEVPGWAAPPGCPIGVDAGLAGARARRRVGPAGVAASWEATGTGALPRAHLVR